MSDEHERQEERLRLVRHMSWRLVEGEVVALDADKMTYLGINGTGAVLWQALQDGATRSELVAAMVTDYEVSEAAAAADIEAFIDNLRERSLLQ